MAVALVQGLPDTGARPGRVLAITLPMTAQAPLLAQQGNAANTR
jgi:hypothetical protein